MKVTITQKLSGTCCFSDIVITILSAQQRTINWSKTCFGKLNSSSHSKSYACCDTDLLRFYLRGKQTNRNNNNILGVGRQHRARHNAWQHVSLPHFICLLIWIYKLLFAIPPITPFSLKCNLVAEWHSHCDGHCAWVKLFPCGHGQGVLVQLPPLCLPSHRETANRDRRLSWLPPHLWLSRVIMMFNLSLDCDQLPQQQLEMEIKIFQPIVWALKQAVDSPGDSPGDSQMEHHFLLESPLCFI